ncbi:hypothetical protein GCM10028805_52060 [Spirosoma harenae]
MTKPKTTETASQLGAAPSWKVVGLEPAESMPIQFEGRTYDLARLTDEEAQYLLTFPDQVPYLLLVDSSTPIEK